MKLWRKLANKVIVDTAEGPKRLNGRSLKQYHQNLSSTQKPASNLMLSLIKRI